MDERAFEELCKWHDEQAAMLRSEAGNLPAAAVAADMHAKTSAALQGAADEIKRLRSGAEPGFGNSMRLAVTSPIAASATFLHRSSGRWRSAKWCSWVG
jgi:hypothetical protein